MASSCWCRASTANPGELVRAVQGMRGRVDGLLLMALGEWDGPGELAGLAIPTVLINTVGEDRQSQVMMDSRAAARGMAEHLRDLGLRRLAFICGPDDNHEARERLRGVREAAAMLQLEPLLERKPAQLSGGQRQRVVLGAGAGAQAAGVPARRAAVQPGCQAARQHPGGDCPHPCAHRRHYGPRHTRPGRSHDPGRAHRGDARWPYPADRQADGVVSTAGEPVRGRFPGQSGGEFHRRAHRPWRWRRALHRRGWQPHRPARAGAATHGHCRSAGTWIAPGAPAAGRCRNGLPACTTGCSGTGGQ